MGRDDHMTRLADRLEKRKPSSGLDVEVSREIFGAGKILEPGNFSWENLSRKIFTHTRKRKGLLLWEGARVDFGVYPLYEIVLHFPAL